MFLHADSMFKTEECFTFCTFVGPIRGVDKCILDKCILDGSLARCLVTAVARVKRRTCIQKSTV